MRVTHEPRGLSLAPEDDRHLLREEGDAGLGVPAAAIPRSAFGVHCAADSLRGDLRKAPWQL